MSQNSQNMNGFLRCFGFEGPTFEIAETKDRLHWLHNRQDVPQERLLTEKRQSQADVALHRPFLNNMSRGGNVPWPIIAIFPYKSRKYGRNGPLLEFL